MKYIFKQLKNISKYFISQELDHGLICITLKNAVLVTVKRTKIFDFNNLNFNPDIISKLDRIIILMFYHDLIFGSNCLKYFTSD